MNKTLNIAIELKEKAKKLVTLHQENSRKISILEAKILELNKIIENQKTVIINLGERLKIQKITKTIESGKDSYNAKIKINEIVREIDKCIALLNN